MLLDMSRNKFCRTHQIIKQKICKCQMSFSKKKFSSSAKLISASFWGNEAEGNAIAGVCLARPRESADACDSVVDRVEESFVDCASSACFSAYLGCGSLQL